MVRAPRAAAPPPPPEAPRDERSNRERIVDALMALLAERAIEDIDFNDISSRAGVPLADCRAEFASVFEVLAAHYREVDRKVLAGAEPEMAEEPPRERLFDVLMRRLEVLAPHKAAVRSLMRSAYRNPAVALALNQLAVRSHQWMLTAAGIDASGTRGAIRAQGLACLFSRVIRVWLDDDDPRPHARGARSATRTRRVVGHAARRPVPARPALSGDPLPPARAARPRRANPGLDRHAHGRPQSAEWAVG
jgi:AcrR family transcriptional regulator